MPGPALGLCSQHTTETLSWIPGTPQEPQAPQLCLWQSSVGGSSWSWLLLGAVADPLVGRRVQAG